MSTKTDCESLIKPKVESVSLIILGSKFLPVGNNSFCFPSSNYEEIF